MLLELWRAAVACGLAHAHGKREAAPDSKPPCAWVEKAIG